MKYNHENFLILILIISICCNFCLSEISNNMIIGKQNNELKVDSDCEEYKILTNHKHIELKLKNFINLDKVIITDKPLSNCKECQADSHICQSNHV